MFVLFFSFSILRISSFLLFETVLGSALFPASFIVCLFVRAKHPHVTRGKRGDLIRLLVNIGLEGGHGGHTGLTTQAHGGCIGA